MNGGTPVRMIALPARVVTVKALFTLVTSSRSVPGSWPMNTIEAMSSVSSFIAGYSRKRGSLVTQSLATTCETTLSTCSVYPTSRVRVNASCMIRRWNMCSSKSISIRPRLKKAPIIGVQPCCE